MTKDDDLLFAGDDPPQPERNGGARAVDYLDPWVVLIADDDPQVHDMSRMLLRKFVFQGRGLELLSATSAAEARRILAERPDIAVLLLDVVMESDDAGLKLVPVIREEMGNKRVRIVLRTGQPGQAPERDVILTYDINDYKAKTELTAQRLFTTMVANLRAYQDIVSIERNRVGLEKILNASATLFDKRSMREFVEGAIIQLEALLRGKEGSVLCCQARDGHANADEIIILAATRGFAPHVGRPLRACLPPEICADIETAFHTRQNLFAEDRCILVFRTHDHGSNVFFLRRPEPFTADERTLLEVFCTKVAIGFDNVCLYEDLTALNNTLEQQVRERAREAQEKSRLLEATLAGMSDGLAAVDEQGLLVVHNRRALELLGQPVPPPGQEHGHEEIERRIAAMAGTALEDDATQEIELDDGRFVQLRRTPMDGGGHVYLCLDVTDDRLHQRELIAARAQAEAASRAKSQFLATMSHEIRTPMTGVQGMLDLLLHTPLNEEQQDLVSVVRESAASLLTIINDILDFSKIEAGKMVLENAPVSLLQLTESSVDVLASTAAKKGVFLVSMVDPALPAWLSGDAVRLRQILFNLMGNAIKFTERGHVAVRAELLESLADRVRVRLTVADTGIGISEEVRARLFLPFSQADATTTRRFGGTGLGLSICRHLVDLMGGAISLESQPGLGTTFHVDLALERMVHPPAHTPDLPRLEGRRVAVELSNPVEAEAVHRYLRAAGALPADDAAGAAGAELMVTDAAAAFRRPGQPTVLLSRRKPPPGEENAGLVVVPRPMRRMTLLRAARAALGQSVAKPAGTRQPDSPCAPQPRGTAAPAILVAEDNAVNRLVIQRLLKLLGHDAEILEDGRKALAAWRTGRYDLLLTDCHMPDMDGFALARAIRAEEAPPHRTPIIAFTAAATLDEVRECTEAGMDDFLAKPIDVERLRAALARWLP
ncbi:signal transduction histidine-protein kinase BarA [mine drainage metagenome]|uniref:histidine kinase n=1 Tax=mine drainage metagenome TaxID=410659 RepID=A0A1J5SDC9_9ZZZZ